MYYPRLIDKYLAEWASKSGRKPLLLRGARQVGKSSAVRNLGTHFDSYVEINFEKDPALSAVFQNNLDVKRIISQLAVIAGKNIIPGKTLLFIDEIQSCPQAIMALRFFKEDLPDLHVVAAGSLLEFTLEDIPTFGVGRIHSMFMYPMTFDEFAIANGENLLIEARESASIENPLPEPLHQKFIDLMRTYLLVGGMPEVVSKWVETHDYLACQEIQDDIIISYEDDFSKYHRKIDTTLLRQTLRSAALQATKKFVYSAVGGGYKTHEVKKALELLTLAGLIIPVTHTSSNGLPLGSEADSSYQKMLLLDSGLMLRLLNMSIGNETEITTQILTSNIVDLVNKGSMAEMLAGLEILHYQTPNLRHDLYYWTRTAKNAQAEIDYITSFRQQVLPIEIKAGVQGGMKSLWGFLREKKLTNAVRMSLENFGILKYVDNQDNDSERIVTICPLYAISQLNRIMEVDIP